MLRRIEADDRSAERTGLVAAGTPRSEPVARPQRALDAEAESLSRDRAKRTGDAISISHKARELVARLRPVVVRVVRFWDHQMRSILVAGRRVYVDPSGSYRVE